MENLKALVYEGDLTPYQRALAQREFKDMVERLKLLEKAVKNNAVLQHVINWVAVKEQLPPNESKKYLVFRDGEIQFDKWIFDGTKGYWWDYLGITHWCEIPEPPCL